MTCAVKSCKNIRRLLPPDSGITFHKFPTEKERFLLWLGAIGKTGKSQNEMKNCFVCSDHFQAVDFSYKSGRKCLKISAVPSTSSSEIELEPIAAGLYSNNMPPPPVSMIASGSSTSDSDTLSPKKRRRTLLQAKSSSGSEKASGSDSSGTRKRKRNVLEHNYCLSPRRVRQKIHELNVKYKVKSKKCAGLKKTVTRLKRKVTSFKAIIHDLKSKHALSNVALDHVQRSFGDIPNALFQRILRNAGATSLSTATYPEELRRFAVTLHFYSARAYSYVRRTFNLALPHPSTIRKWSSTVNCMPGFSKTSFDVLKIKADEAKKINRQIFCNLIFDEMSIKKNIDFDGTRNWGYIDIGMDFKDDEVEPATEALVLMVVAINSSWKLPVAYFFIKALTGEDKANIVKEALIRLHDINITVTSVTCDGPPAHFTMFKSLGCNFDDVTNLKPYFNHPKKPKQKVYAIFDVCHMLKLMRNTLGTNKTLIDIENNVIRWSYIEDLHLVQEEETLLLANKLNKSHINWQRQKMKVKLAAQTLSNSVAEAISFLDKELKHPKFKNSEATVLFIKTLDKLFDLLNSRLPWGTGLKGPLKESNEREWRIVLEDTIDFLINLKTSEDTYLWKTQKKTTVVGFAITISSILGIYDTYVKRKQMNYLLTYKLSQDHLELFFCSMRARNGWNNNPSALQFMRSYRQLLLHADISDSSGNCQVIDCTSVLHVSSARVSKKTQILTEINICDLRRNNVIIEQHQNAIQDHNYDILPRFVELDEYCQNVVTYMSGYVIKMLVNNLQCPTCLDLLMVDTESIINKSNYRLMRRRNLGPYHYPSKSLIEICYETEMFIRKLMFLTENKLPSDTLMTDIILNVAGKLLPNLGRKIFIDHEEHSFMLLKQAIYCYCKIRLHNLAKKYSVNTQGDLIRKQFAKLILFHHQ